MTEATTADEKTRASFAEHVRAFHAGLPREEQQLLEQMFALAQASDADTSGYWNGSSAAGSLVNFQWGVGGAISDPTVPQLPSPSGIVVAKTHDEASPL